jgi:hypothetical protein
MISTYFLKFLEQFSKGAEADISIIFAFVYNVLSVFAEE